MSVDILDELSRFDNDFAPTTRYADVEALPDGYYDVEIVGAAFDRTQEQRLLVCRWVLRVIDGPKADMIFERLAFLDSLKKAERFGGELKLLGFDTESWKAPLRPFSVELGKALPKMIGMKFHARKVTRPDGNRTYHNLDITGLLKPNAGKAPAGAPAAGGAPAPAPAPAPRPGGGTPAPAPAQAGAPAPAYSQAPSGAEPF